MLGRNRDKRLQEAKQRVERQVLEGSRVNERGVFEMTVAAEVVDGRLVFGFLRDVDTGTVAVLEAGEGDTALCVFEPRLKMRIMNTTHIVERVLQ